MHCLNLVSVVTLHIIYCGGYKMENWKTLHLRYSDLSIVFTHLNLLTLYKAPTPMHCLNFGIGGDATHHILWRLQNGELENIAPKVTDLSIVFTHTSPPYLANPLSPNPNALFEFWNRR